MIYKNIIFLVSVSLKQQCIIHKKLVEGREGLELVISSEQIFVELENYQETDNLKLV
jgi:hypothetical protein